MHHINRLTIDIFSDSDNHKTSRKKISSILRYHEDLILHHLKKKTNFGGYGYFHTKLYDSISGENFVKNYGQILEVHFKNDPVDMNQFMKLSDLEKLNVLLDFTKKSVQMAESKIESGADEILIAISQARETGLNLKKKYDDWWKNYYKSKL